MVKVRLLKDCEDDNAGDIINYSKSSAAYLVQEGYGEYVNPDDELKKQKKKVHKKIELKPKNEKKEEKIEIEEDIKDYSIGDYESILEDMKSGDFWRKIKHLSKRTDKEEMFYTWITKAQKIIASLGVNPRSEKYINKLIESTGLKKQSIQIPIKEFRKEYEEQKEKEKQESKIVVNNGGLFDINDVKDNVLSFYNQQRFFYDDSKIYWFWNNEHFRWEIVDKTDILSMLDNNLHFNGKIAPSSIKSQYMELIEWVGRRKKPKEAKTKWIQFKNKAFSLSGKIHKITPDYFFTNPIPWDLGDTSDTPTMDRLFKEWVGEDYVPTLYEIIAYCCYRDYPIQLLFSLCGSGRNGKSQFLKILDKFIGESNVVSSELDRLLTNRFESFKLYKKLVCSIGETNFSVLDQSSMLKKLTGGDKIGFEKKNKDPFDDYNYSKPIIASNSLPTSSDTSEGFYRRWLIIDFPNEFEEKGHDVVDEIPEEEYNALAKKVTEILPKLLARGKFTNQGSVKERKDKYIAMSNPLEHFIKERCEVSDTFYESSNKIYSEYIKYLKKHKKRIVKRGEFTKAMDEEGFYQERTTKKIGHDYVSGRWMIGLRICSDHPENNNAPINENSVKEEQVKDDQDEEVIRFLNTFADDRDNKHKAELFFGEDRIKKLLTKGVIMEDKPNHLKMV